METRVFDVPAKVRSTDGSHSETFDKGERVKNVQRFGRRVMFEPVSTQHIAGTYVMDWSLFEAITTAVRVGKASHSS